MEKRLASFIACLLVSIGMTFAQNEASGTVIFADDGAPVIGASVIVL